MRAPKQRLVMVLAVAWAVAATIPAAHAEWMKVSYERPRVASSGKGEHATYGYGGGARVGGPVLDLRGSLPDMMPVAPRSAWRSRGVETLSREEGPKIAEAALPTGAAESGPDWLERETVGKPYKVNGRAYTPAPSPGYSEAGLASWYGEELKGRRTANGEVFDPSAITAAHPTLPLPSLAQVTNLENGREVIVRINDRGPFVRGRLIDVSRGAAEVLGFREAGDARVHVRYLGPAPKRVDGSVAAGAIPVEAPAEATGQEIQGPEAAAPAPVEGGYIVQLGAFSDPANAERARAAARPAGEATIVSAGGLHRVRLVGLATREEAEAAARRAAEFGLTGAIVTRAR